MAVYKLFCFVALVAIVGHAQAQVLGRGSCPSNVTVISNFNVTSYLGTWFEYAKYQNYFQGNGSCVTAEYSLQSDGNVGVRNTQINATGEIDEINGYATVVGDGKLLVTFPTGTDIKVSSNYWVLDTDYSSYSVVYSCQNLSQLVHSTFVWVLTRERIPSNATITSAKNVLELNKISLKPLMLTNQKCVN